MGTREGLQTLAFIVRYLHWTRKRHRHGSAPDGKGETEALTSREHALPLLSLSSKKTDEGFTKWTSKYLDVNSSTF
jgi:hypothetical protein